jgi:hypothetical protein
MIKQHNWQTDITAQPVLSGLVELREYTRSSPVPGEQRYNLFCRQQNWNQ